MIESANSKVCPLGGAARWYFDNVYEPAVIA